MKEMLVIVGFIVLLWPSLSWSKHHAHHGRDLAATGELTVASNAEVEIAAGPEGIFTTQSGRIAGRISADLVFLAAPNPSAGVSLFSSLEFRLTRRRLWLGLAGAGTFHFHTLATMIGGGPVLRHHVAEGKPVVGFLLTVRAPILAPHHHHSTHPVVVTVGIQVAIH